MARERPILVLLRKDLRLADNGALSAAVETGRPVLPVFLMPGHDKGVRPPGAAYRWWLRHSLEAFGKALHERGSALVLRNGVTHTVVRELVKETDADAIFWNRRYDPAEAGVDARLKHDLREDGLVARSFDGQLLHEPSLLQTKTGGFYKVYTPFWRALSGSGDPRDPIDAPSSLHPYGGRVQSETLTALLPLPTKPDWAGGLRDSWTPGEVGAHAALQRFLEDGLKGYGENRDRPDVAGTSRLSPHLAHGEITPFQILAALRGATGRSRSEDAVKFHKEVVWREFCYHLLFHNPRLATDNFQPAFDSFPWRRDQKAVTAWQRGLTGHPIVDAGMRELWQTGVMHNRVRMIAASFLIKHLMIDWRTGEQWFWDTLVDADCANNPANWQWVAGSGADASPYFRIFNPVLQGEKFDPEGDYVRRFVPELARMPPSHIHRPWEAPDEALEKAGVTLGKTYPKPIIELDTGRDRALSAYKALRHGDEA